VKGSRIHLLLIVVLALMTAAMMIAISPLLIQQLSKIVDLGRYRLNVRWNRMLPLNHGVAHG